MAAKTTRTYERELEVALWWRDFRATNNAHFLPLLFDRHRYYNYLSSIRKEHICQNLLKSAASSIPRR